MVALKTTEAMVPGSNPAATIVENSENRLSHYVTSGGNEGDLPTRRKKEEEKIIIFSVLALGFLS